MKTNNPSGIREIRNRFGFDQSQLAIYLSVTLGQLKMAETGKRSLPTAAHLKLAQMALFEPATALKTGKALAQAVQPDKVQYRKTLQAMTDKYEQAARTEAKKLETMRLKYEQAAACLALMHQLSQNLPKGEQGKKDSLWLQLQQLEATKTAQANGPAAQDIIQLKMDCFQFGAARSADIAKKRGAAKSTG